MSFNKFDSINENGTKLHVCKGCFTSYTQSVPMKRTFKGLTPHGVRVVVKL